MLAEVVDRVGRIDVIHSECLLFDPQRTFIMCDRLIVLALTGVRASEVVDRVGRIDVIHSECLLKDPQRTFIMCDRLIVLALTGVRACRGC